MRPELNRPKIVADTNEGGNEGVSNSRDATEPQKSHSRNVGVIIHRNELGSEALCVRPAVCGLLLKTLLDGDDEIGAQHSAPGREAVAALASSFA